MFLTAYQLCLIKLVPFYILIILGYFTGRCLNLQKETLSSLLIYVISPIIVFDAALKVDLKINTLSLPMMCFLICSLVCWITLKVLKNRFDKPTRHLLAYASGSGNVGYFGLPVALGLFGEEIYPEAVLCILGFNIYGYTVGFYVVSKGKWSTKEISDKILGLPVIYTLILGILLNYSQFNVYMNSNHIYTNLVTQFIFTYSLLGMMVVGMMNSKTRRHSIGENVPLVIASLMTKFIIWPLIVFFFLVIQHYLMPLYQPRIEKLMVLFSIVPIGANTVVFATELKVKPEKASLMVLVSTTVALLYIPLIMYIGERLLKV